LSNKKNFDFSLHLFNSHNLTRYEKIDFTKDTPQRKKKETAIYNARNNITAARSQKIGTIKKKVHVKNGTKCKIIQKKMGIF